MLAFTSFNAKGAPNPAEAKLRLGGDVEIRQADALTLASSTYLMLNAAVFSRNVRVSKEASHGGASATVEMIGIDDAYPPYGKLELTQQQNKQPYFSAPKRRSFGVAANQALLKALNLKPGERFTIGAAEFMVTAVIKNDAQPNPRAITERETFRQAGLAAPGSDLEYLYLVTLPENTDLDAWEARLKPLLSKIAVMRDWRGYE